MTLLYFVKNVYQILHVHFSAKTVITKLHKVISDILALGHNSMSVGICKTNVMNDVPKLFLLLGKRCKFFQYEKNYNQFCQI